MQLFRRTPTAGRTCPDGRACPDDRGSLTVALLVILVGLGLSALLTPVVITQLRATATDVERVHALHAAESGLEVALAQLRAADDGSGAGLRAKLPCGPLTGSVGAGAARYQVSIAYYGGDPTGRTQAWLSTNAMTCLSGAGTYSVPAYALLIALGTDVPGSGTFPSTGIRELRATYKIRTTNENIAGGLIHVYKTSTSTDLCLDAGSLEPVAGTAVQMQACNGGSQRQLFTYQRNLNLVLVSSMTSALPQGMCLDAGAQTAGTLVRFQPCTVVTSPQQQWSINDAANFEGTTDGVSLNGKCFNVQTVNTPGSFVIIGTASAGKCRGGYDNVQTWAPDAKVGAGAAGASSGQLVNFKQFARCLDVTGADVNSSHLIAWPCKQAPDPSKVLWNQKWALPNIPAGQPSGTGSIVTKPSSGSYCLRSPLSPSSGYVRVISCPGTPNASTRWTVYGGLEQTGSYATAYTITDSNGDCLTPLEGSDYFAHGQNVSKTVVRVCDGSTLQKWNASPNILKPVPLQNLWER